MKKKYGGILTLLLLGILFWWPKNQVMELGDVTIRNKMFYSVIHCNKTGQNMKVPRVYSSDCLDLNGDGTDELGLIHWKFPRGRMVKILSLKEEVDVVYEDDLSQIKPWKIQFGDVTGNGIGEIALGVVKETPLHPVMAKRCFFYNLDFQEKRLVPRYRASRFCRPFTDFILLDMDGDGICEVISMEKDREEGMVLAGYQWHGFGFFVSYERPGEKTDKSLEKRSGKLFVDGKEIPLKDETWKKKEVKR